MDRGCPLYRLRGQLLPLVFLDRILMHGSAPCRQVARDQFIAVLDVDGRRFGLVVDGLADPEEIVVKPLSAVLKKIELFSGATVLGNAELALILDLGAIAQRAGIGMSSDEETSRENEVDAADGAAANSSLLKAQGARRGFRSTVSSASSSFRPGASSTPGGARCSTSRASSCRWTIPAESWLHAQIPTIPSSW